MIELDFGLSGDGDSIKGLKHIQSVLKTYQVEGIESDTRDSGVSNSEIVEYLKERGIDLFAIDSSDEKAIETAAQDALTAFSEESMLGGIPVSSHVKDALAKYCSIIIGKIENQSGSFPALKEETIRKKGHAKVGIDTGALLENLRKGL